MLAPPKPPHDDAELLIKEARARQLQRRLIGAAGLAVAAAVSIAAYAIATGSTRQPGATSGGQARPATGCRVVAGWRLVPDGLWSEPTGQHTLPLALRRTGTQPCSLDGYPTVVFLDAHGQRLGFSYTHNGDQVVTSHVPHVVHVDGHGSGFFLINKYRCDIRAQSAARWVRVNPPGVSGWLVMRLRIREPIIDFCPAERPSRTVAVSPLVSNLIDASRQPGG